jgi:uncharacterized protein with HEPN domain
MNGFGLSDYLEPIHDAAMEISQFVRGFSKEDFVKDNRTWRAILSCVSMIGEVATLILKYCLQFAKSNKHIPWHNMSGMRNRIIHGYFNINLERVYEIAV